jgi:hypothetical protein
MVITSGSADDVRVGGHGSDMSFNSNIGDPGGYYGSDLKPVVSREIV